MNNKLGLFVIILIGSMAIGIIVFIQFSPSHQAKSVVKEFYNYEQEGKFADSWELFHSQMKNKFEKGHYLQDRAHVFMNHFGVTSFEYTLSGVDKVTNWKMSEDSKPIHTVYRVTVTQTYKGKYGNFDINQEVFATEEKDEWKILWNYNK